MIKPTSVPFQRKAMETVAEVFKRGPQMGFHFSIPMMLGV